MIRELYEINNGFFDPLFGSIELPKPEGEAKTFVICGNGTGIPVFRQLQKVHTTFIAGVLYTNDVDYRLARLLADQVITEKPFMEISGETCLLYTSQYTRIHRTTYFRWREQAFEAVGSILWGYEGESERILKLICKDYEEK